MAEYLGQQPFEGLTEGQANAIEIATKLAPPEYHDGLWRLVAAQLDPATAPWSDPQVVTATKTALANAGVASPFGLL